tara:strand:+ start:2100 stop:3146 length:1047 start_codon:yes stop_codon:yes gene_type:complete
MKKKANFLNIALIFMVIILITIIFQYFMTKNYLDNLRSSSREIIDVEKNFEGNKEFIIINNFDSLKFSPLIAVNIINNSTKVISSELKINYSSEVSVDKYKVNYSNYKNFKIYGKSESIIYLIPYLSSCFFKLKDCKTNTPILQNIEILKNKNIEIKGIYSVNINNLPFIIELIDFNQKYLFSENEVFSFLKNLFKYDSINKNSIDIINDFRIINYFKESSILKNGKIKVSKRENSLNLCSGKFNEAINLKPRTVSICGQEFKIIETKKMLINGDNFHLKGKLYKGSLLVKIENKFGEIITKAVSKKGNFDLVIKIPKSDYFKIEINGILNAYNFPEIKFDINSALVY